MADRQGVIERPKAKLSGQAFDAGAEARRQGKGVDAWPEQFTSALARAWRAGWNSVASALVAQPGLPGQPGRPAAPPPTAEEWARHGPRMPWTGDPRFWPSDRPLPQVYARPPIPCPHCRRVLTDTLGRAVLVRTVRDGTAHLRCRCCKVAFKLKALK